MCHTRSSWCVQVRHWPHQTISLFNRDLNVRTFAADGTVVNNRRQVKGNCRRGRCVCVCVTPILVWIRKEVTGDLQKVHQFMRVCKGCAGVRCAGLLDIADEAELHALIRNEFRLDGFEAGTQFLAPACIWDA
jgi:hypothetical protein